MFPRWARRRELRVPMNVAFAGLHIVFSGLGNCVFPELPSGVNYGHRAWPARRAQGTACSHGGRAAWNCGFLHWPLQDHSRSARGKCECPELPPARTTRSPGAACARRTGNCVFPELASRVNYAFTGRGLRAKNRELRVPTAGALQGSAGFPGLAVDRDWPLQAARRTVDCTRGSCSCADAV